MGVCASKNLLLTGRPGVGKTTVVRGVVEHLGVKASGFFTEEMRQGGQRVGFRIITTDGQEAILAHVNVRSPYRVGRYGVSTEGMQGVAVPTLLKALKSRCVIVIDEIARMELHCQEFRDVVDACLDSTHPVVAVVQMTRLPFLDRIRTRPDVEVVEVTLSNRDGLPLHIVAKVQGWLRTPR